MSETHPPLIPVNVISGFLGSGKTTLLKSILADEAFGNSAVLINEFGEISLDHLLLGDIAEDAVLLQSGCVCCTIRGELSDALRRLLSQREEGEIPLFKRIILETTGLADPGPIASTITADPVLRYHLRPGTYVTVLDAINGRQSQADHPVWTEQVAAADKIVVSKTDIATAGDYHEMYEAAIIINPTAKVLGQEVLSHPSDALFADGPHVERWGPVQVKGWLGNQPANTIQRDTRHLHDVVSFRIRFDGEVDWTCLGIWLSMLLNRHGRDILRVKGVLHIQGDTQPVVLHGVQHTIHPPEHLDDWPEDDRRSELIFITRGITGTTVAGSLKAFMEKVSALPSPRITHE
jgi:G3E family GTPase